MVDKKRIIMKKIIFLIVNYFWIFRMHISFNKIK